MSNAYIETSAPSFVVADVPLVPLELTITDAPDGTTGASVTWELEDGSADPVNIGGATFVDGVVTFSLPAEALADAGVVAVAVTLTTDAGGRERLEPLRIPVEPPSSKFLTLAELRARWADAPEDNATLYDLSQAAIASILDWAPDDPDDPEAPSRSRYRRAHVMQARAAWQASTGTTSDQLGDGEFAVTIYPLDWHVKNTLRGRDPAGGIW